MVLSHNGVENEQFTPVDLKEIMMLDLYFRPVRGAHREYLLLTGFTVSS